MPSLNLSVCLPVLLYLSVCLSACLPVYLSMYLSIQCTAAAATAPTPTQTARACTRASREARNHHSHTLERVPYSLTRVCVLQMSSGRGKRWRWQAWPTLTRGCTPGECWGNSVDYCRCLVFTECWQPLVRLMRLHSAREFEGVRVHVGGWSLSLLSVCLSLSLSPSLPH